MSTSALAASLTLPCGATLPNRLAKAAMSEVLADPDTGAPTAALERLYERWGQGGAGLLITGHVIVDPGGRGEPGNVLITDERHLEGLTRWAQAAQRHGARLWMQLNHAGRQSPRRLVGQAVAPSEIKLRGFGGAFGQPRALTGDEIAALIARFATAARVAKTAGFAGVQVHGAHGYLVSQFLSPRSNQRTDEWGGDAARRARFLLEVVRAIRGAVGAGFPVGVKLNSADFQRGGFSIEESMEVARQLEAAGVDLLEISGGNYESPAMAGAGELPAEQRASSREREAYFLDYARRIRAVTRLPLMLTGGLRTRAVMEQVLAEGAVDVLGLARPLAHAPDLPRALLDGSADAAPVVRVRSAVRSVDNALQVFWFQEQLHRMARGQEPDPKLSRYGALWRGMRALMFPVGRASKLQSSGSPPA
ncbi:MAG: NADH:flavin oxidoreductase/NADH oxidase family protein [Myxococcales bacterium]|nr:NADH:flavin oxidoreductase/NADH oxidase family protein [Myxococcales bacterium]